MRVPVIPTIVVLVACGIMVWLGIWQLGRADEKAELIARYEAALANPQLVEIEHGSKSLIYRNVRLHCQGAGIWQAVAGRNASGRSGYAHRYDCPTTVSVVDGKLPAATFVDVGWSAQPVEPEFSGGIVDGVLVPLGEGYKVVATEPLGGLQPLAKPDPNDLPNNHLSYAVQWFLFALTALVIYILALRRRRGDDA